MKNHFPSNRKYSYFSSEMSLHIMSDGNVSLNQIVSSRLYNVILAPLVVWKLYSLCNLIKLDTKQLPAYWSLVSSFFFIFLFQQIISELLHFLFTLHSDLPCSCMHNSFILIIHVIWPSHWHLLWNVDLSLTLTFTVYDIDTEKQIYSAIELNRKLFFSFQSEHLELHTQTLYKCFLRLEWWISGLPWRQKKENPSALDQRRIYYQELR